METQTGQGPEAAARLPGPLCFHVFSEMLAGDRTEFPSLGFESPRLGEGPLRRLGWFAVGGGGAGWVGQPGLRRRGAGMRDA